MGYIKSVVDHIHAELSAILGPGDLCLDATCGNGQDTCFMAELVGDTGHVFAFDIQTAAIEGTKERLKAAGLENRVTLFLAGHEELDTLVKENIRVAVFNLGYLPNSDQRVTTRGETTIRGIENAMTLLENGGVIFIALYWGHREGQKEKEMVLSFIRNLATEQWSVMETCFPNRMMAPYLIVLEKRKKN